ISPRSKASRNGCGVASNGSAMPGMRPTSGPPCRSRTRVKSLPWPRTSSCGRPQASGRPPMTLDEILGSLFPSGHDIAVAGTLIGGQGRLGPSSHVHVLGVAEQRALGIDEALVLAGRVIDIIKGGDDAPILVLIDSSSQRMSRRDELLGLNEYLAH